MSLLGNAFNPVLPTFTKVNFLSQDTEIWKEQKVMKQYHGFLPPFPVHMTSPLTLNNPSKKLPSAHSIQVHHHHHTTQHYSWLPDSCLVQHCMLRLQVFQSKLYGY